MVLSAFRLDSVFQRLLEGPGRHFGPLHPAFLALQIHFLDHEVLHIFLVRKSVFPGQLSVLLQVLSVVEVEGYYDEKNGGAAEDEGSDVDHMAMALAPVDIEPVFD